AAPRRAGRRRFPRATLASTASRFSFRRGGAEAAASRQAAWWADWRGYASSIDALTEWPWGYAISPLRTQGCGPSAHHPGVRTFGLPPRGADLRPATQGCGPSALPLG